MFGGHHAAVGLGFIFVLTRMLAGVLGGERAGRLGRSSVGRRGPVSWRWGPVGGVRPGEMVREVTGLVLALSFRHEALLLDAAPVLVLHLLLDPGRLVHLVLDGHAAGKSGPIAGSSAQFPSRHFHGLFKMLVNGGFSLSLPPVSLLLLPSLLLHGSLSLHSISLHPLTFSLLSFFFFLPLSGGPFFL